MKPIRDLGEDALIRSLLAGAPVAPGPAGPGDDCAVIEVGEGLLQLLKTDAMIEGVHWEPQADPLRVGWKAVARVISDFAAMGGRPADFLITIALPPSTPLSWATELYRGIGRCLKAHGGRIVGGETSGCPEGAPIFISVAARGEISQDRVALRSGGNPGDLLWVTGTLGGSLAGKHLDFQPRLEEAAWLVEHFKPTAMMDLSDGLGSDLPRLAEASGCGFELHPDSIPCSAGCTTDQAIGDGEDYELLFSIAADRTDDLLHAWQQEFGTTPLTAIGKLCDPSRGDRLGRGWDHFH